MHVYILFDYERFVSQHFRGVFSSKELAQKYAEDAIKNGMYFDEVNIEEHKVNGLLKPNEYCNTKDFPCSYPECNCGNIEEPPPQPEISLSYEQLEQLYFAQCEATDEWARKCKQLHEENANLTHDLNQYISIANSATTELEQLKRKD